MERSGIVEILKKSGMRDTFSGLLARFVSYIILFIFIIVSLIALRISPVEKLLESMFLYLPNIFAALLILFVGFLLGNFLGTATLIACVNAGLKISSLVSRIVKFLILLLTLTMVMEQLGIGRETIEIAFAVILGGFVFALSLAFGLGGRDSAKNYIEKKLKEENDKDEIRHL
ncbi:MAG: hypothetical protein FJ088_14465 [Deltaproteobacteria bacterium]|nr:hypothetical protein [Deltaproteobacteria bacterium]